MDSFRGWGESRCRCCRCRVVYRLAIGVKQLQDALIDECGLTCGHSLVIEGATVGAGGGMLREGDIGGNDGFTDEIAPGG